MSTIGARLKWQEGKILHPSEMWKSPSKRRLPRLLVEERAKEVGIQIYLEEPWIIFEESDEPAQLIEKNEATSLELYRDRFYLLPKMFKRQDTYSWLSKPGNKLLLWSRDNSYFVKSLSSR